MASIVRILLMHPSGEWFTFWESQLLRGDPSIEYLFSKRSEYRIFEPLDVCQTNFPTDRLRLELDTRSVVDWNELDYVKLTGSASLPAGALLPDEQLTYVPDPDQSGQDSFEYTMSDCAFNPKRQPAATVIEINIVPVNDAPVASQLEMTISSDLERYRLPGADGISIDLSKLVTDVDDEAHIFTITSLLGRVTARIDGSNFLLVSWPAGQSSDDFGFKLLFNATDSGGLVAQGLVQYTPKCRPEQFLLVDDAAQNGKDSTDFRRCVTTVTTVNMQYIILGVLVGLAILALGALLGCQIRAHKDKAKVFVESFFKHEGQLAVKICWDAWVRRTRSLCHALAYAACV